MKGLRTLAGLFALLTLLSGCSAAGINEDEPTPTPVTVDTQQDIASGCWTASQRTMPVAEQQGGRTVQQWSQKPAMQIDPAKSYQAIVETTKGTFTIDLFGSEAPLTVNNFVCLAKAGFYDGVVFHRIVRGFVIQGGDPTGTGSGGPGYRFDDEPVTREYQRGTVAMANAGPNTNGSQFFVCLEDLGLPKQYTIFGQVTEGMEVVDAIAAVQTRPGADGANSSPVEPVVMNRVTIQESPTA
jgi:cyclophilin family peptidyl-prolyl cis-trans isomerase